MTGHLTPLHIVARVMIINYLVGNISQIKHILENRWFTQDVYISLNHETILKKKIVFSIFYMIINSRYYKVHNHYEIMLNY